MNGYMEAGQITLTFILVLCLSVGYGGGGGPHRILTSLPLCDLEETAHLSQRGIFWCKIY